MDYNAEIDLRALEAMRNNPNNPYVQVDTTYDRQFEESGLTMPLQEEIDLEALENLSINGGLMLPTGDGSNVLVGLYGNGITVIENRFDRPFGALQINVVSTQDGLESINIRQHPPSDHPIYIGNQDGRTVLHLFIPGNTALYESVLAYVNTRSLELGGQTIHLSGQVLTTRADWLNSRYFFELKDASIAIEAMYFALNQIGRSDLYSEIGQTVQELGFSFNPDSSDLVESVSTSTEKTSNEPDQLENIYTEETFDQSNIIGAGGAASNKRLISEQELLGYLMSPTRQ